MFRRIHTRRHKSSWKRMGWRWDILIRLPSSLNRILEGSSWVLVEELWIHTVGPCIFVILTVASSRYIPGTSSGYQQPYQPSTTDPYTAHTAATPTSRKHLPQKTYLSFKVGELGVIINKMNTFNTEVPPNHVPSLLPYSSDIRLSLQKHYPKSLLSKPKSRHKQFNLFSPFSQK